MSVHSVYTDTLGFTSPARQPTQILKEWLVPFSKDVGGMPLQVPNSTLFVEIARSV